MTDDGPAPFSARRERISAVLCVLNEAHQIARCLDALAWCDEVIVVDRFSKDATREIAEGYPNVRFFQREDWTNPNMNFGIEQASGDWILRIDCDEIVSSKLAREIETDVLAAPRSGWSGSGCRTASISSASGSAMASPTMLASNARGTATARSYFGRGRRSTRAEGFTRSLQRRASTDG